MNSLNSANAPEVDEILRKAGKHEVGEIEVKPNVWEFPVAQTKKGLLWGTIEESRSSKRILAFRGIKYAQPPVGNLRWKAPTPVLLSGLTEGATQLEDGTDF